jgi:hypothetical protein
MNEAPTAGGCRLRMAVSQKVWGGPERRAAGV